MDLHCLREQRSMVVDAMRWCQPYPQHLGSMFDVHKSVYHHKIQIIQPTSCNSFTSLLLNVNCGSTCFGRLPAHHQEHTTALGTSGFTTGEQRPERCWSWSGQVRLLVQLYALDEGRGNARNMLSHT
jgi:hypothetical protein